MKTDRDTTPDGRPIPDWILDRDVRESIKQGHMELPERDAPPLTWRRIVVLDGLLAAVSAAAFTWGRTAWRKP